MTDVVLKALKNRDGVQTTCESEKLRDALFAKKIRFAHWKGNSHLMESLSGKTDIELLIHPEDRYSFESIMSEFLYKKLEGLWWNKIPGIEDWIGFDSESGKLLHLHTHFALTTGVAYRKFLYLPWLDEFFRNLGIDKASGWPIPRPEMELINLLFRIQSKLKIKDREFLISRQDELIGLVKNITIEQFILLCKKLNLEPPKNTRQILENICKKTNHSEVARFSATLYNQLPTAGKNNTPGSGLQLFILNQYFKTLRKISKYFGPRKFKKTLNSKGKIIAIVGSDGSGKSTISDALVKWLSFKIDTHYFYFGKNPFIRSNDKKLFSFTDILTDDATTSKFFRKITGRFYPIVIMSKKVKMFQMAKKIRERGSVIICDRFPQSDVLGMHDGPKLQQENLGRFSKLEMKLYNKITNQGPDLIIKLNVSPGVAISRKPGHDLDAILQKCNNQHKIKYNHSKVVEIDANQTYEQVLLSAKRDIWQIL